MVFVDMWLVVEFTSRPAFDGRSGGICVMSALDEEQRETLWLISQ